MGDWADHAACRNVETAVFFGERGCVTSAAIARRICGGCLVTEECLEYAIANRETFGVFGGKSPKERRAIINQRIRDGVEQAHMNAPVPHGTPAGYAAHGRRGVPMCEPCRVAHNEATARRMADRRARGAA
jgi:WhiB family redox-sensing transcriptional regulator